MTEPSWLPLMSFGNGFDDSIDVVDEVTFTDMVGSFTGMKMVAQLTTPRRVCVSTTIQTPQCIQVVTDFNLLVT